MNDFNLYRAKKLFTGEWITGYLVNLDNDDHVVMVDKFIRGGRDGDDVIANDFTFIDPATSSRFTTLYDKNDNKIYEGDVVECNSWNEYFVDSSGCIMKPFIRKFIVVWRNGAFELEERYEGTCIQPSYFKIHDSKDLTVIGNIF